MQSEYWGPPLICLFILVVYYGVRFYLNKKRLQLVPWMIYGLEGNGPHVVSFVLTHPNDEAYYFSPTLEMLGDFRQQYSSVDVHALVLSKGNYSGEGDSRVSEMQTICNKYKMQCTILDEPDMQMDTPTWDKDRIAELVQKFLEKNSSKVVITFDEHGVNSDSHRISAHDAVMAVKEKISDLRVWMLASFGSASANFPLFAYLEAIFAKTIACVHSFGPVYQNVKIHESESSSGFKLFFNSYGYVNIFKRL
ncbi:N-ACETYLGLUCOSAMINYL-PH OSPHATIDYLINOSITOL DE-N-ACETYLASE, putative [Babesia bigemina]|uniref:N-acetylglucosaminylphosphatidylinositol deacetylase n=1 Tax=Babesia bigemina TaxID=5866 RepID=A0A061DCP4_BABBI|nr:N-ACETYLGLUCOSAMINYL-PH OSPHATIDYLINOSITOL DE-N-ACETYLASE, putative [Babesia bigemina]CDR96799.1 N-ACETYLGLUCOSAMINYL-PH OSPHATIDYLINOSITOL DE-N-ACETYLASE, putative [Babesia bigemina]|eukprot:XP_012768985.1 N-ACETYLGLUCOSAMINYL-PH OSPHATIDYLINOSITOL DE-N-ACETYLASE, putative [Babesia bigemina]